ncbi:MAG: hypothetical protein II551_03515 [Paludibacteraceae bacterium]|nr:hypothetical protein [Paludibacteraceae bacterium]
MRRFHLLLILAILSVLPACNRNNPTPRPAAPKNYAAAYLTPHGKCYDSIEANVLSLDLYSDGLTLDSAHHMQGTGYNLYLSDIFVSDAELTAGTYRSDSTGALFTFLPGRDFGGMPSGAYLLTINEGALEGIQLLDSGTMIVRDTLDGEVALHFTLYHDGEPYETHYTGTLLTDKDE